MMGQTIGNRKKHIIYSIIILVIVNTNGGINKHFFIILRTELLGRLTIFDER